MLRELAHFGTAEYPLRASGLPSLMRCPWRAVLLAAEFVQDQSGKAADTGSVVHLAAKLWHGGQGVDAVISSLPASLTEFPLADLDDAGAQFRAYTEDPRNSALPLVLCETKIEVSLPCSEKDPTGKEILIHGTLDQVRHGNRGLEVWDIKTSSRDVWTILHDYTYQLAVYALGAEKLLGKPVHPGGFIRTRTYTKRGVNPAASPDAVFLSVPWGREHISAILDGVREVVAHVRAGELWIGPGEHCSYCPAKGIDVCLPKLVSLGVAA